MTSELSEDPENRESERERERGILDYQFEKKFNYPAGTRAREEEKEREIE